jgi:2-oxoglutarate dehydrogenase complex dehydrogenase (E1) component-like enzyme
VWTLRELHRTLNIIYSTNIGFEYVYINNEEKKYWLMNKFEEIAVKTLNVPV